MLATLKRYPSSINLLLGASLVLTLARAITLPYLVIYLSGHFSLSVADIGLAIGSTLIIGSLLSLYGGFLVDRMSSYQLILICCGVFSGGFLGAYLAPVLWLFYLCLVLINLAYAVIDIAVKSGFGSLLPMDRRSEAFSIKYTLTNIGYAVGPFLGVGVAALDISLPFCCRRDWASVFLWSTSCGVTGAWRRPGRACSRRHSWQSASCCCVTTGWCASPSAGCSVPWFSANSPRISRNTWWSPPRPKRRTGLSVR